MIVQNFIWNSSNFVCKTFAWPISVSHFHWLCNSHTIDLHPSTQLDVCLPFSNKYLSHCKRTFSIEMYLTSVRTLFCTRLGGAEVNHSQKNNLSESAMAALWLFFSFLFRNWIYSEPKQPCIGESSQTTTKRHTVWHEYKERARVFMCLVSPAAIFFLGNWWSIPIGCYPLISL